MGEYSEDYSPDARESGIEQLIRIGAAMASPRKLVDDGHPFAVIPDGHHVVDLEEYDAAPSRIRGRVSAHDADSFIRYCKDFKAGNRFLIADSPQSRIGCILNYSADGAADFGDHAVSYSLPYSEEWERWTGCDGSEMNQSDFALFLEENSPDITKPEAAKVIEVARSLTGKKNVTFKSGQRVEDGSIQLEYSEEVSGGGGASGRVSIPSEFEIGIPVYFRGERWKIVAKLRYRFGAGGAKFWYDLHRLEHTRLAAFEGVVEKIEKETGLKAFYGSN